MFYLLSWLLVVSLIALWSLAAWALHAVAVWAVSNAGALSGTASGAVGLALPDWLAPWLAPQALQAMNQLAAGLGPLVERLLQSAPALADGLTLAAWVVWGTGSVLLMLLGAALHLLIALWRRHGAGPNSGHSLAAG